MLSCFTTVPLHIPVSGMGQKAEPCAAAGLSPCKHKAREEEGDARSCKDSQDARRNALPSMGKRCGSLGCCFLLPVSQVALTRAPCAEGHSPENSPGGFLQRFPGAQEM